MKAEFHNCLGGVEQREITRLTIYDAKDNPTVVAIEFAPGVIFAATAEHPDFNQILRQFGLNKTVVVQDSVLPDLTKIAFD